MTTHERIQHNLRLSDSGRRTTDVTVEWARLQCRKSQDCLSEARAQIKMAQATLGAARIVLQQVGSGIGK